MSAGLLDTQTWFLRRTTAPTEPVRPGTKAVEEDIERRVRRPPSETARQRVEIYRQSYFARLEECLADDYRALKYVLGGTAFSELCRSYVMECPSHNPNLNHFGAGLPAFLRQHRSARIFDRELAELEWTMVSVLHADAPPSRLLAGLGRVDPAQLGVLTFVASPSARLLRSSYPVNPFWQAFINDREPAVPKAAASFVVVVRNEYKIWRVDLDGDQAKVLGMLLQGQTLGMALHGSSAAPTQIQRWFQTWASAGVFTSVRVPGGRSSLSRSSPS